MNVLKLAMLGVFIPGTAFAQDVCDDVTTVGGVPAAKLIVLDTDATATATYCGTDAGYTSELYLAEPTFVYIATAKSTAAGTTVDLGAFTSGDELIFAIYVRDTRIWYYSGDGSLNPDGVVHAAVTDLGDGNFQIGFEDFYGGGDNDYNDITMVVSTVGIVVDDDDNDDDGVADEYDNCPLDANAKQEDADSDGIGDACDACPDGGDDDDADGLCTSDDNCPDDTNAKQEDGDGDGAGDVCDVCPKDPKDDADADGYCADEDNCPSDYNDQTDSDKDGAGDTCDVCAYDAEDDADGDGLCGDVDACADTTVDAPLSLGVNRWADRDGDGVFETTLPKGKGPTRAYDIYDTAGCSCTQIADELGLGEGHYKFGCSISAMDEWTALMSSPAEG